MSGREYDIIVIGGSSGSIRVIMMFIDALPASYSIPIVIVEHRKKNVKSELATLLSASREICEPEDKEPVTDGRIYLAPQNYHLLVEMNNTFSMDYSEPVHYSRPSIDVTFTSIADVYKAKSVAILLSGANDDGSDGLAQIIAKGGRAIIQQPASAEFSTMPEAAIKKNPLAEIHNVETIVDILLSLKHN